MIPYLSIEKINEIPKLWLCKPDLNRAIIARLTDIYNFKLNTKENTLSEITFDVPVQIERNHELIENPILDKFKGLYYIKMVKDGKIEYFVSSKHNGTLASDGLSKSYQLFSLGHQLDNKNVRNYEGVSQNLTKYATDMLSETNWSVGSVDVEFDKKNRMFEVSTGTVLQCLYDLAELFGAYIEWDTVNRRVSFYDPNKIGLNRGLRFKDGHYLESFNVEFDYDEIITRLKVYGQDGLEFRRLSPTGMNYVEDFTWFMYPFQCDENYNVISSSYYMTDDLCIALTKYNRLLESKDEEFKNLVTQRTSAEDNIVQKEQELSVLETELKTLYNELDVINATYGDNAPSRTDYKTCMSNINAKKSQILIKESEIETLNTALEGIDSNITALRNEISTQSNFTPDQLIELNDFIIEGEHTNDSIVDEQDLLDEGIKVFKTMSVPKITLSMGIANFLNTLEDDPNRKKLILGDTVRFKSEKLKIELSARLSEINYDYESDNISVTVTNARSTKDEDEKAYEMINGSIRTATTVDMDKFKWNQAVTVSDDVSKMLANTFDATLKGIKGGVNDTITLNERGLYSSNLQNPNNMLVIQGGVFAISADGLNSVQVAINKDGVHAPRLIGNIVLSNKLHIEDELGIVKIESGTATFYDASSNVKAQLGKYTLNGVNKYGLFIPDGSIDIRTSATSNRGVQFDTNGIRSYNSNGVQTFSVDSATGKIVTTSSFEFKTSTTSSRGVVFDANGISGYNSSGTRTFYLDTNGNLTATNGNFTGTINATGGRITGNLDVTGTLEGGTFEGAEIIGGTLISTTSGSTVTIENGTLTSSNGSTSSRFSGGSLEVSYRSNYAHLDYDTLTFNTSTTYGIDGIISYDAFDFRSYDNVNFIGDFDFSLATVTGLDVDYAAEAGSLNGYDEHDFVQADTSGLSEGYSSTSNRWYFRRNGRDLGYIDFDTGEIGM